MVKAYPSFSTVRIAAQGMVPPTLSPERPGRLTSITLMKTIPHRSEAHLLVESRTHQIDNRDELHRACGGNDLGTFEGEVADTK